MTSVDGGGKAGGLLLDRLTAAPVGDGAAPLRVTVIVAPVPLATVFGLTVTALNVKPPVACETSSVNVRLARFPWESTTATVKLLAPADAGTPLITPVAPFSTNPEGSELVAASCHEHPLATLALRVKLYGWPSVAPDRVAGERIWSP
jgi:hypothetical protein